MKKKYLTVAAAALSAAVMLAACGSGSNGDTTPTPTPTPTVSAGPTQDPAETPAPTDAPVAVDPQQMVNNIHQAVQEAYGGLYSPSMQMQEDEMFMTETLKLDASWYDAAIVETMMMAVLPDTFIIVHPTEGNLENVAKALEAYKETLVSNAWYPTTTIRAQGAQTGVAGDYVYFAVLTSSVDDMAYENESQVIEACKESTQLAIDTVTGVVNGDIVVEPWTEMDKLRNVIMKSYSGNYFPNVQVQDDEAYMTETLKLDASWYDDALVEIPMISANADKLIIIDASEGNLENVQRALEAHKQYLIDEALQYPMNMPRVQSAVVATVGDYVIFSILGGAIDDPESYGITTDEDLIAYYTSQNETAVWAVQGYLNIWE